MSIKTLKANGLKKIKMLSVKTNASYMLANNVGAHFEINAGTEYVNCKSMITISMDANTPYNQITNIASGPVKNDGNLSVEVRGSGLLPAHIYTFNILLFDQ